MMETFFFRATPETSAAFYADVEARNAAYRAACAEIRAEYPGFELVETRYTYAGVRHLSGLRGDTWPGPLWVKLKHMSYWTPTRKSKAGKALDCRIEGVRLQLPRLPGVPYNLGKSGDWQSVGWGHKEIGGILWAESDTSHDLIMAAPEFDATIWTPEPASSYFLAKEAASTLPAPATGGQAE